MKLEYLQKIIARIQSQIHCPKCKAPFAEDSIEIKGVKGQQVEFSAECSHCKARSQISAEISGDKNKLVPRAPQFKRQLSSFDLPQATLKPADLTSLTETLRSFKGADVRNLFE